jgi:uncharacterized protein YndB with AHSA1/START domain
MSAVTVEIAIDAPRELVFETMLDTAHLKDWVTIHKRVDRADTGEIRKGYTMDQTLVLRGAPFKVKWALTQFEPHTRATWEGRGPGGSYARTAYTLSDAPGGGTRFEYLNEYRAPGGFLGAAASRALVGGTSETEAKRSLQALKQLLER